MKALADATTGDARLKMIDSGLDHYYPQVWLLLMTVVAFSLYVAWDLGLIQVAFDVDRSYLVPLIAFVFVIACCHALWHIVAFSSRIRLAHRLLDNDVSIAQLRTAHRHATRRQTPILSLSPVHYLGTFFDELECAQHPGSSAADADPLAIIEIHADGVRSPVEVGWFLVDLSIRLGLIGTIVGFILIFSSLSGNTAQAMDEIQQLLVSMSSGMGTALYTTLFGLVSASILGFQYMILSREVEHLIGLLIRMRNLWAQSDRAPTNDC